MSDDPIRLPINGELDLHTFLPKEIPSLLDEYIGECVKSGISTIRIVHGKGTGTLRELVHARLKKNAQVLSFVSAPPEAGGWGATTVRLRRANRHSR
jgi:DNA-nicking Smr family endonuclease